MGNALLCLMGRASGVRGALGFWALGLPSPKAFGTCVLPHPGRAGPRVRQPRGRAGVHAFLRAVRACAECGPFGLPRGVRCVSRVLLVALCCCRGEGLLEGWLVPPARPRWGLVSWWSRVGVWGGGFMCRRPCHIPLRPVQRQGTALGRPCTPAHTSNTHQAPPPPPGTSPSSAPSQPRGTALGHFHAPAVECGGWGHCWGWVGVQLRRGVGGGGWGRPPQQGLS